MNGRWMRVVAGLSLMFAMPVHGRPAPVAFVDVKPGDPIVPALDAFRDGKEGTATELAKALAERGDGNAFFLLGVILDLGPEPARMSKAQAMELYYGRAEEAGHPEAKLRKMLVPLVSADSRTREEAKVALEAAAEKDGRASRILGEAWLRGLVDGNRNREKAENYWNKALTMNDEGSLTLLAEMNRGSFGFPGKTDRRQAVIFFRKAAGKGDNPARVALGDLLLSEGKPDSEREGRGWLDRAIESGDRSGYLVLGDHANRDGKGGAEAIGFYQKGAAAGHDPCMLRLANCLLDKGRLAEGREWLVKSADAGNAEASAQLGRLLAKTEVSKAYVYLLGAANEGISSAQYDLAMMYLDGSLGQPDSRSAVAWLTQAMKAGDAEVQYRLATLHESGSGCPINYANAGVLYTLACNKGHALAPGRIARMANEGLGMKKDPVQAWAYASLGAERGDTSVSGMLASLEKEMSPAAKVDADEALSKARSANVKSGTGDKQD